MRVLLLDVDSKFPNIALMRLASHYRHRGDAVTLDRVCGRVPQPSLFQSSFDAVFASSIFTRSSHLLSAIQRTYPNAVCGGTGSGENHTLLDLGVPDGVLDYSDYIDFASSIGFSQRGCRLQCAFCVVPGKEGQPKSISNIHAIWRGAPWPKQIILLDNDFFGQSEWRQRVKEITEGEYRVSITQGINARNITSEQAAALVEIRPMDWRFRRHVVYCAWDDIRDQKQFLRGLDRIIAAGTPTRCITVYMLIGYEGRGLDDAEERRRKIRAIGAVPYPMPYSRTKEMIGYQRWVVGAYDKTFSWYDWKRAGLYPTGLKPVKNRLLMPVEVVP